jgi:carboxyl-terminal processing protease
MIKKTFLLWLVFSFSKGAFAQPAGKLDYTIELLKYWYVDTINDKKLSDAAVVAMLKELDPHSSYIPADELKEMNEPLLGKFEGIGIQFNILNDTLMVTQTIAGGPSEKLGIRAGDRIVKIDDVNVASVKLTNNDVLKKLRGDKGTKVKVAIARRGVAELLDFTITRDQIPLFSIDASYEIAPGVGYIKVSRFADNTANEFHAALEKLKAKGIKSLIVDLEGNGGGYLNRAVELADEFIADGKKVVYTRGRQTQPEDYMASTKGLFEAGKLIVLIDETSASASEIVSGAVQDWDRGLIIGRRSFGKGLVQKPFMLPDGSMIRLTVSHYYTPSGRCIQKPYTLGDEDAYEEDIYSRYKDGELFSADSIKLTDSTKYYTNNKRLVYGGGGIIPDIFVPIDTTMRSDFYTELLRKNAFNDYILTYTDNNRTMLKEQYPTIETFRKSYNITSDFFEGFLTNAYKLGVKPNPEGLKTSEQLLKIQLRALIARNLWDVDAYFQIINDLNPTIKKALSCLQDNSFEKMKIAYK